MDKKTAMEIMVREAHEKDVFTGTWLYAENGKIVSKGAVGFCDPEDKRSFKKQVDALQQSVHLLFMMPTGFAACGLLLVLTQKNGIIF